MFGPVKRVYEWMRLFEGKWMVAGGWAIDLHIGEETRKHEDIEVAIFRDEQHHLGPLLAGCETMAVDQGRMFHWNMEKRLEQPVHEIHVSKEGEVQLEILLNERSRGSFRFRRNEDITFPLSRMNLQSEFGIPYLNPEIVLLYKSKNTMKKDEVDFIHLLPHLNEYQREWLKQALIHTEPNHPWLLKLLND